MVLRLVSLHTPDCGIFPAYDPSEDIAFSDAGGLYTPHDFANYSGVDENAFAGGLYTPHDFANHSGVDEDAFAADETSRLLSALQPSCFGGDRALSNLS